MPSRCRRASGGTQFFDIGTAEPYSISGEAVRQRDKLIEVIQQKEKDTDYKTAYQYVIEEVAYTWFNRLIAIRFMEVNDYLPSHHPGSFFRERKAGAGSGHNSV